jgi:hypothetical protein
MSKWNPFTCPACGGHHHGSELNDELEVINHVCHDEYKTGCKWKGRLMSETITDFPKITQMLDAGWTVQIRKDGSYIAKATHKNHDVWKRAKQRCYESLLTAGWPPDQAKMLNDIDFGEEGFIYTDDFTPEQALTMLAYKVHGELAPTKEPQ